MIWERPTGIFQAKPIEQIDAVSATAFEPSYRSDEGKKKLFGVELAKNPKPFEAALQVFGDDTNAAMWVSWNWLSDPIVLAAKDIYLETVGQSQKLLDKEQLAFKLLELADEKDYTNTFYVLEGKDRIAALKLYAEIQGYAGKLSIDASTTNIQNNELKIQLIPSPKPDKENDKVINLVKNDLNEELPLPVSLKLVGNSR